MTNNQQIEGFNFFAKLVVNLFVYSLFVLVWSPFMAFAQTPESPNKSATSIVAEALQASAGEASTVGNCETVITNFDKITITGDALVTVGNQVFAANGHKKSPKKKVKEQTNKQDPKTKIENVELTKEEPPKKATVQLKKSPSPSDFFFAFSSLSSVAISINETRPITIITFAALKKPSSVVFWHDELWSQLKLFGRTFSVLSTSVNNSLWSRPPPTTV